MFQNSHSNYQWLYLSAASLAVFLWANPQATAHAEMTDSSSIVTQHEPSVVADSTPETDASATKETVQSTVDEPAKNQAAASFPIDSSSSTHTATLSQSTNSASTSLANPSTESAASSSIKRPALTKSPQKSGKISSTALRTAMPTPTYKAMGKLDWLPNKYLEDSVLDALRKLDNQDKVWNSVTDITPDDMKRLTTLDITQTYIDGTTEYKLDGLRYATNLTSLTLDQTLIGSNPALSGDIRNVNELAGLTKLTDLDIQSNKITDISHLKGLTNLTSLEMSGNHISDFRPLADLKIDLSRSCNNERIHNDDALWVKRSNPQATINPHFYFSDGSMPTMYPIGDTGERLFWDMTTNWYLSGTPITFYTGPDNKQHYRLESVWQNPDGSLTYSDLYEQKPGKDLDPNFRGSIVKPLKYQYYLMAVNPQMNFFYTQPYEMYDGLVNIHYLNSKDPSQHVHDDTAQHGDLDQPFTITPLDIKGYHLTGVKGNTTGKITSTDQDVTYYYAPNVVAKGTVTVHFVANDAHQTPIAPNEVLSGKPGDAYTTSPANVPGYSLLQTPESAHGTYSSTNIDVMYIYRPADNGQRPDDNHGPETVTPTPQTPEPVPTPQGQDPLPTPVPKHPTTSELQPTIKPFVGRPHNSGGQAWVNQKPIVAPGISYSKLKGSLPTHQSATTAVTHTAGKTTNVLPQTNEQNSPTRLLGLVGLFLASLGFFKFRQEK